MQSLDFAEAGDSSIKDIEFLSHEFKHRHTGLEDEREAAVYISESLNALGIKADTYPVSVVCWRVKGKSSLRLIEPEEREIEFGPGGLLSSDI